MAHKKVGNKQSPTPLIANNTTGIYINNNTVKYRRFPAVGIQFYWLKD